MSRLCTVLVLLGFSSAGVLARSGYVQTCAGRIYEGQVRFEPNAVVVVNAAAGVWAEVTLTNLASVTFIIEPPPVAGPVGGEEMSTSGWRADGAFHRNRWFVPQVELQSGSALRGYIVGLDDTALHFETASGKQPVSRLNVTRIRFQPLPSRMAPLLNAGRTGVLLISGEFVDGDCRNIEGHRVTLSSVPLGHCRYDINREVIAIVLRRQPAPAAHFYEVKMFDGSVWLGLDVAMDREGLLLREPSLGPRRIPIHEIQELRRRS
jgi:hypothetical protein